LARFAGADGSCVGRDDRVSRRSRPGGRPASLDFLKSIAVQTAGVILLVAGGLPDAESSLYFSGVTYTTLGYGDLLLPNEWRLFGTA
jgi:ion channel